MKALCTFLLILFFSSCDPLYHLSYSLKNETGKVVYVKFKNYPDSLLTIPPNAVAPLVTKTGVGFAREKYKSGEYQDWLFSNAIILSKENDSTVKKVKTTKWKYKGGFISGRATLTLKK